jgi:uncharacterized surface protein with fasciclin (FAS1) repeats
MQDILDCLSEVGSMQTLLKTIEKAGMTDMLKAPGPYTLFAPNDEAFARMNTGALFDNPVSLKSTISYHLATGRHTFDDIRKRETLGTENGKSLTITIDEGETVVYNGKFIKTDIEFTNGIIHIIDNVFQPHLSGWYGEE